MDKKAQNNLISFLDKKQDFTIHIFRGKDVLDELTEIHDLKGLAKKFFKDVILTFETMISFLKPGEGFGIYIDSEEPYFRFKIETNWTGTMRTLLLPEDFNSFPEKLNGQCRVSKIFKSNQNSYTSIIEMKDLSFSDLGNKILRDSYQMDAEIHLGEEDYNSVLVLKLPRFNIDKENSSKDRSLKEYWIETQSLLNEVFKNNELDEIDVIERFKKSGFEYLKSSNVHFKCSCSKDRFVNNLKNMHADHIEEIFQKDESIEIKCDYCKTKYELIKSDLIK